MPIVKIDRIDTLRATERNGVIRNLTRRARVINLTSTDYTVLWTSLAQAGIPASGSRLTGTGFEELILVERSPAIVDEATVDVDLGYEHVLDGNQDLIDPSGQRGIIYGKTRCSIQQTTTNFYRANGVGPQQQVIVAHRFPEDDPDYPDETVEQGGEITVFLAQRNLQFEGFIDTRAPWALANALIASINSGSWCNQGPHEWMCTEVQWQRWKEGRYKFSFEFQHNSDTWNPTAVFVDQRTGKPPPNLVANVGYQTIPYHKLVNYNRAFNSYFEGWQQVF